MMGEILAVVSAVLFGLGTYGALTSRSAVKVLISLEIMFNGAVLAALMLTSSTVPGTGFQLILFSVALGSVEVGVLVSILILLYRRMRTVDVYQVPGLEVVE
uniref:NADH-quinone oxidoreductase subunit NuoK n=1 Tax=Thermofilum pendens TaxID=2269 RepID=A0A7C3WUX7_THEPE